MPYRLPVLRSAAPAPTRRRRAAGREQEEPPTLPALTCDVCTLAEDCPEFVDDHVLCAYDARFAAFGDSRDPDALVDAGHEIASRAMGRLRMAWHRERLAGGKPEVVVTKMQSETMGVLKDLADLKRSTKQLRVTATGPAGASILATMFGAPPPARPLPLGDGGDRVTIEVSQDAPVGAK